MGQVGDVLREAIEDAVDRVAPLASFLCDASSGRVPAVSHRAEGRDLTG